LVQLHQRAVVEEVATLLVLRTNPEQILVDLGAANLTAKLERQELQVKVMQVEMGGLMPLRL
jgi:hypothetical protein